MPFKLVEDRRRYQRKRARQEFQRAVAENPGYYQDVYAKQGARILAAQRVRYNIPKDGFPVAHNATPKALDAFRRMVVWYVADNATRLPQWKLVETVDGMIRYGRIGDDVDGVPHSVLAVMIDVSYQTVFRRRTAMRLHVPILREFARIAGILRDWER